MNNSSNGSIVQTGIHPASTRCVKIPLPLPQILSQGVLNPRKPPIKTLLAHQDLVLPRNSAETTEARLSHCLEVGFV